MTYEESLGWLYSTQQFGIKLGLDNIRRLLKALGDPHEHLSFLHVAGTNGKGSVCAMLEAILRAADHKTGLYTSPHLIDFRERIRVGGNKIPREATSRGLENLRRLAASWDHSPTFFEFATALALQHFAESDCEFVVLETGMGGRLDATNAVMPVVSVITPIALDHTRWLGKTVAEVAWEKAGIIKPSVPRRQRATGSGGCGGDCQACGRAGVLIDVCGSSLGPAEPGSRAGTKRKCGAGHRVAERRPDTS